MPPVLADAILPGLSGMFDIAGGIMAKTASDRAVYEAHDMADDALREARIDRGKANSYARKRLRYDRAYAEKMLHKDNKRADMLTAKDRKYYAGLTAQNRKYARLVTEKERALWDADTARLQKRSNRAAEAQAASRGIDFKRMRDDAIAAGFNPLTAMSMAGAYSTEVGYQGVGTPYSGSALSGGDAVAGPASNPGAQRTGNMPSGASYTPSGGFTTGGAGYQTDFMPSLASGSFVMDALSRATDSWYNTTVQRDLQAEQIRASTAAQELDHQQRLAEMRFGYDLSREVPYRPGGGVVSPSLARPGERPDLKLGPFGTVNPDEARYDPASDVNQELGEVAGDTAGFSHAVELLLKRTGREWDQRVRRNRQRIDERLAPYVGQPMPFLPMAGMPTWFSTGRQPVGPALRNLYFR